MRRPGAPALETEESKEPVSIEITNAATGELDANIAETGTGKERLVQIPSVPHAA